MLSWSPHHTAQSLNLKLLYLASVLEIRGRAITMCTKTPLLDLACLCFCHGRLCNTDMCACASPSLWFYTQAWVLSCTGWTASAMCTIDALHSGYNHFRLTLAQVLLIIYLPTCVNGPVLMVLSFGTCHQNNQAKTLNWIVEIQGEQMLMMILMMIRKLRRRRMRRSWWWWLWKPPKLLRFTQEQRIFPPGEAHRNCDGELCQPW